MSNLPTAADGSPAVYCAVCDSLRPFAVDFQESEHGPFVSVYHISLFCKGCRVMIRHEMSMSRRPFARRKQYTRRQPKERSAS